MATRVLNTIKDNGRLVGFRIICSSKSNLGEHILNLGQAKVFYKTGERFENVKYIGHNQWEGVECSLDKFPVQDKTGRFVKCVEKWFVLGKMFYNDEPVGFKLMDLQGNVDYLSVADTISLGLAEGFINAKLVSKDNTFIVSGIRSNVHNYAVEKLPDKARDMVKAKLNIPVQSNNSGASVKMDDKLQKERYKKLAHLFGLRYEKKASDADIAKEVGASTPIELSYKIHEYLGEPSSVSDKTILDKLYKLYLDMKNSADVKSAPVQNSTLIQQVSKQQGTVSQASVPIKRDDTKDVPDMNNPDIQRMKDLIEELTKASLAYYSAGDEIMSNYEYDKKYDELEALEKKTGVILNGSLTQNIVYESRSKLPKVRHSLRMLSLDKTKDRQDLANSLGGQPGFLSWKLDGLTIVLYYENGELQQAVTRGDGQTGEDITHNAKFFKGVPLKISYTDKLTVRGEALISYKRFEEINAKITDVADKYKNPRNLASGSVRQLDSKIAKDRGVEVVAFTVVEGFDDIENYSEKLEELRKYGFDIVPYVKVTKDTTVQAIADFEAKVQTYRLPTDGLVITIDNIAYGEMLGTTAKFPRNSKAFKWKDEVYDTEMVEIDWSVGRTGAITPVAVFNPVDIDGSTITRASVHNVSIFKQLQLGKGDIVSIFKANMIIPQIAENKTKSGTFEVLAKCPVCGHPTSIIKDKQAEVLMCLNADCPARHLNGLAHFVSREAMNIDGLSDATLERFVNEGYIKDFKDIYHLNDYEDKIIKLDGFGRGSYNKLWKAIEKSRECELPAFINSLGIPQMGKTTSKDVCRALDYDLEKLMALSESELQGIDGVGNKTAHEIAEYFKVNAPMVRELVKELRFKAAPVIVKNSPISGLVFCITGDVYTFKNRKELQAKIESLGAKASSSVSSKTNYLINNDVTSTSNKNQTAKKLGVPIISEADFLKMIGE